MKMQDYSGPRIEKWSHNRLERSTPVGEGGLVIGRGENVAIGFEDRKVSRDHARITRDDDGVCYLLDTSKHHATFLNGRNASRTVPELLKDGDKIRVADHELIFRGIQNVAVDDRSDGSTVLRTIADLSSVSLSSNSKRPADAFRAVLDLHKALSGGGSLDEILARSLQSVIQFFPAAVSGLVVTSDGDGRLPIRAFRHRDGASEHPTLSRSIVNRVLKDCEAVLVRDSATDDRFLGQQSVQLQFRTALCVPLPGSDDRAVGMVQLSGEKDSDRVFNADDLELLAALARPIGAAVEMARLLRERTQWAAASQIQRALLPSERPDVPGYQFWDCYRPALEIGGDLYDYIRMDQDGGVDPRWVIGVGDVCGKGLPAALMSAAISPEVRHPVWAGASPADVLTRVNRRVSGGRLEGRFVTLILAELDPRTHTLTFANAGHELPLLRRADGSVETLQLPESGMPVGVEPDTAYRQTIRTLQPGELIVLHSDGLGDALNVAGKRFGLDAVAATLSKAPPGASAAGDALLEAVTEHAKGRNPFDDLTIVCIGRD